MALCAVGHAKLKTSWDSGIAAKVQRWLKKETGPLRKLYEGNRAKSAI
jgi:hypothetical protein